MMFFRKSKRGKKLRTLKRVEINKVNLEEVVESLNNITDEIEEKIESNEAGMHVNYDAVEVKKICRTLIKLKFIQFLQSTMGGMQKYDAALRNTKLMARFLLWTHANIKSTPLQTTDVVSWCRSIITDDFKILLDYSRHMETGLGFAPGTIKIHIMIILNSLQWFIFAAPRIHRMHMEALASIRQVAKVVYNMQLKRAKILRAHRTMVGQVLSRRMPAGGLQQLQEAVNTRVPWAESLVGELLNKSMYKLFMSTLFAALYVYSVQGRLGGVASMKLRQGRELIIGGFSNSTEFKTAQKYKYQPVTMNEVALLLFTLYMEHFRPQVQKGVAQDKDPLWLNFAGEEEGDIGRLVTAFFKDTIHLHITTTAIRTLVETTVHSLHLQGLITADEKAAVHSINGHSSGIADDWYVLQDRVKEVAQSRKVFDVLSGKAPSGDTAQEQVPPFVPPTGSSSAALPLSLTVAALSNQHVAAGLVAKWPKQDLLAPADWGTARADYANKLAKKAAWTELELDYIARWKVHAMIKSPFAKNLHASCLKDIMKDPEALPIFHEIHVFNSDRLHNGFRILEKRAQQQ